MINFKQIIDIHRHLWNRIVQTLTICTVKINIGKISYYFINVISSYLNIVFQCCVSKIVCVTLALVNDLQVQMFKENAMRKKNSGQIMRRVD